MNVNGFTHKPTRTRTVRLFRVGLAGALILGVQPLQAATTKRFVLTPAEAKTFEAWTKFLAEGTPTWSTTHAPAFTPAIESTIWQVLKTDTAAQSIANPMIEYLEWRRSLDPTRFSFYHPNLSPALAQLLSSPSLPANPPPPTDTPVPETTTAPQVLSASPSPSPSHAHGCADGFSAGSSGAELAAAGRRDDRLGHLVASPTCQAKLAVGESFWLRPRKIARCPERSEPSGRQQQKLRPWPLPWPPS